MKLRNGSKRTPFKDSRPKNRGSRTGLDPQAVHRFLLNILNWISNRYQFSCACRSVGGGFVSVVSLFSKWKSAFVFKELWFKFNRSHFQKRTLWRQFLGIQGPVLSFFQNWPQRQKNSDDGNIKLPGIIFWQFCTWPFKNPWSNQC